MRLLAVLAVLLVASPPALAAKAVPAKTKKVTKTAKKAKPAAKNKKAPTPTPEPEPAAEASAAPETAEPSASPAEPAAQPAPPAAAEAAPAEAAPASDLPRKIEAVAVPEAKAPSAPPKASTAPTRVAVLDPQTTGEIPERALAAFVQSLVPELRKLQGVSAVGMGEIRDMLAFEQQRQLLGCGDENCLAEIGGALGVDELVTIQLTLTADKYSLSMRRMNMRRAKMVAAEQKVFEQRDGEELLAIVGPMVEALFPDRQLKEGKVRGVEAAVIQRLNPPPLPRWVFVATTVAAVAAAGVGGGFSLAQNDNYSRWQSKRDESLTKLVEGSELVSLQQSTESNYQNSIIFYGVAGGLAVVAAVEAFFTDWHNDRDAVKLMVGPTGVGVSGSF